MLQHKKWIFVFPSIVLLLLNSTVFAVSLCKGPCYYPPIAITSIAPQPISASVPSKPEGLKSGWFVGLGIANSWFQQTNQYNFGTISEPGATPDVFRSAGIQNNLFYEAMVGYQFSFKRKIIPAYRVGFLYQTGAASNVQGPFAEQGDNGRTGTYQGQIFTQSFLIDNQLDLFSYHHFAPYLELGLGMALQQLQNYTVGFSQVPGPFICPSQRTSSCSLPSDSAHPFAWLGGAGLGYQINLGAHELALNLGLRYLNQGNAQTAPFKYGANSPNVESVQQNVSQMQMVLDVRYFF